MSDYGVLLQVVNGLSLGAMYALLALGFTLVYGILELINFAHFNVFMVSSFVGMWALQLLGISGQERALTGFALVGVLGFAFIVTMLAAGILGVAIERISLRRHRGDDHDDRRLLYPVQCDPTDRRGGLRKLSEPVAGQALAMG